MRGHRSFFVVILMLLLAGGLILAYGLTIPLTTDSALAGALWQTQKVRSVHVVMDMEYSAPMQVAIHQEGDIVFPDRMHMVMSANGEEVEYILVRSTYYFRDSATGVWQKQETPAQQVGLMDWQRGPSSWLTFDPQGLARQASGWVQVERLPDEVVDGIPSEHYRAVFDVEKMMEKVGGQIGEENEYAKLMQAYAGEMQMEGEYWVGKVDGLVRKMRTHITMPGEMLKRLTQSMVWGSRFPDGAFPPQVEGTITIRYSNFNKPVNIEPPVQDK